MKVILAKEYGFCQGVRAALNKLDKVMEGAKGRPVYSVGEIIHNKDVIQEYQAKGVVVVGSIFDVEGGIGVVRAHGLPQSLIDEAGRKGLSVVDATCHYVRRISKIIQQEIEHKVPIFLIGEPNHPEVIAATKDYEQYVTVIDYGSFDPGVFNYPKECCALISQTTMSEKRFTEISAHFIRHCATVHIHNTICPSTRMRQGSALETACEVDVMLVLGGKNSSNTRRLYELCHEIVPSYHIERISELDRSALAGMKTVGITAGASTPDWIVQEAVKRVESL